MPGHGGAVLDLRWSLRGNHLFTASADKTHAVWDAETGDRLRRWRNSHTGIVNAVSPARHVESLVASAGDDGALVVSDMRTKKSVHTLKGKQMLPLMACAFFQSGNFVASAGVSGNVDVWDLRKGAISYTMSGHTEPVTALELSPDGTKLLSNAMDNTVRLWDVQPYASGSSRQIRAMTGAQHNFEKNLLRLAWSQDGRHCVAGSADRSVYIWETASGRVLYALPGHKGSVNCVDISPKEPIVVSGGSDKNIYLGELHF